MAMHGESDGESTPSASTYRLHPRWTPLVKREERLVELAQDGEDEEVDELAGDEDEPWLPPVSPRSHSHHPRALEGMIEPPPKKKLFGF